MARVIDVIAVFVVVLVVVAAVLLAVVIMNLLVYIAHIPLPPTRKQYVIAVVVLPSAPQRRGRHGRYQGTSPAQHCLAYSMQGAKHSKKGAFGPNYYFLKVFWCLKNHPFLAYFPEP